jgi:ABC-2 type transport system ATP-binding protein
VITLEAVAARRAPLTLASITLDWGPGVHAVVGTPADGGPLLLALVAGAARTRKGGILVLGADPTDAAVRVQVAFVPLRPALPDALRVGEVLEVAASVRGEPPRDPVTRLATLGVEALAARAVRDLSDAETRAVALAEATTSTRARVILVEEPLVGVDPRAEARLPLVLRGRARDGCAVVLATASLRDAGELADDHVLLRSGAIAGRAASPTTLAPFSPSGVRIRVVASDPRALLAALAAEGEVEAVARRETAVVARGRDTTALAEAVGRAVLASGVEVVEIRIEPPSLGEAGAASAGIAAATYEAARAQTRAGLASPSSRIPPPEGTP